MQTRWRRLRFFLVAPSLAVMLHAQAPAPQTYSFTLDPAFSFGGPMTVKISRDGAKEAIDETIPAGPGRPSAYHAHRLYDFEAHKIYLKILSEPNSPCSIDDVKENLAPGLLDPIPSGDSLLKDLAPGAKMNPAGAETVNGIATNVFDLTTTDGKAKAWLAKNGGYTVRLAMIGPDGKPQTLLEMKQLSFAKPPAADLATPTGCVPIEKPVVPTVNVTAVTLAPIPDYNGACPAHVKFTGTITTDGPGTVFYQFGAGSMEPAETVVFDAAGTKTVTHTVALNPKYGGTMGVGAILEAIGADAAGKHPPALKGSNNSSFNVNCK